MCHAAARLTLPLAMACAGLTVPLLASFGLLLRTNDTLQAVVLRSVPVPIQKLRGHAHKSHSVRAQLRLNHTL